jgi:hypothetical protein
LVVVNSQLIHFSSLPIFHDLEEPDASHPPPGRPEAAPIPAMRMNTGDRPGLKDAHAELSSGGGPSRRTGGKHIPCGMRNYLQEMLLSLR